MTREQFILELLNMGVPYSTIDAILQFSDNQPNPVAYQALREMLDSHGGDSPDAA